MHVKSSKVEPVLMSTPRGRSDAAVGGRSDAGWTLLGMFGLLLAVIGLVDTLLYLYPPAFESPEWEFGTMAAILSGLPLPTVGFGALAAWSLARGGRKARIAVATASFAMVALIAAAYLLYLLDVPLAWSAASGPQGPMIIRSIVRTTVMGVGFGIGYLATGIYLLRNLKPRIGS